jgi:hypothetical protein
LQIFKAKFNCILSIIASNTTYSLNEKGEASGKNFLAFHKLGRKDPVPYVDG